MATNINQLLQSFITNMTKRLKDTDITNWLVPSEERTVGIQTGEQN